MIFQNITRRVVFSIAVLAWAVLFSLLAWRAAFSVIRGQAGWGESLLWFSLLAVSYLMFAALSEHFEASLFFGFVTFSPSVFFVFTIPQVLVFAGAVLLLHAGSRNIRKDLRSRMELSLYQSLKMGIFVFSVAIALIVSHGYYSVTRTASWEELVPRFSLGTGAGDTVLKISGFIYPELARVRERNLTIDEFLQDMQQEQFASKEGKVEAASAALGISPSSVAMQSIRESDIEQLSMKASLDVARGEFGKLVGRTISGNEKTTDVFAEALRNKLLTFLSAGKAEKNIPEEALPAFLAVLVFFTVLSVAALLQGIWVIVATGLLRLAIAIGILSVMKVPAEREVLQ
jgi:hypothetical protein